MTQFLQDHASALFGLFGAFGAGILSFLTAWLLRKRDYDLRLWDKLLERRIGAHEQLINVALEMRVMVATGGADGEGGPARAPQVLISREAFEEWFTRAVGTGVAGSTWLSIDARREANFLQDYLATLHMNLEHVPGERFLEVGGVIRHDFIDISNRLERAAFAFLQRDVRRLSIGNLDEWHKYPREVTVERLRGTRLLSKWDEIAERLSS